MTSKNAFQNLYSHGFARVAVATPRGKIADPDELTGVVVFLASDDSVHMTGGFVLCDGGFSMVGA